MGRLDDGGMMDHQHGPAFRCQLARGPSDAQIHMHQPPPLTDLGALAAVGAAAAPGLAGEALQTRLGKQAAYMGKKSDFAVQCILAEADHTADQRMEAYHRTQQPMQRPPLPTWPE